MEGGWRAEERGVLLEGGVCLWGVVVHELRYGVSQSVRLKEDYKGGGEGRVESRE
jgi:hypothetical protein